SEMGGFCCPAPPGPRLPSVRQRVQRSYRWHLGFGPITAVPCRAKAGPLLRTSILVRPQQQRVHSSSAALVVEAPGTAPGSVTSIPASVYRHSRQAGTANIGARREGLKGWQIIAFHAISVKI